MAYPYEIDPGHTGNLTFPYVGHPVLRGTNLYQLLQDSFASPRTLEFWKSTDAGLTWAEAHAAGHPQFEDFDGTTEYDGAVSLFDSGGKLYLAYVAVASPPTESNVVEFDPTTDQWGSPITGGPLPLKTPSTTGSAQPNPHLGLVVRSNGDKVLIYTEFVDFAGTRYTSLKFKVHNGTSWGSAINLLIPGTTESNRYNYALVGTVLGTDDRIHVFTTLSSSRGFAYVQIASDNSVVNYKRFDLLIDESPEGVYGSPKLVVLSGVQYAAMPFAADGHMSTPANSHNPALWLVEDNDSPVSIRLDIIDQVFERAANWVSVGVAYDAQTAAIYLMWAVTDTGTYATNITIACCKGFTWSTPQIILATASGELIETFEVSASGGVLRAVFENAAGESPYLWPHYYQSAVTCAAAGCPATAARGNINSVR